MGPVLPQAQGGMGAAPLAASLHRQACRLLGVDPAACPLLTAEEWRRRHGFRPDGDEGVMGRARPCPPHAIWVAEGAPLLVYVHELTHVLMPLASEEWVHQAAETCCGLRQSCGGLNRGQLLAALRWMAKARGIAEAA